MRPLHLRCIVGYFRLSNKAVAADPAVLERLVRDIQVYAEKRSLPVKGVFVDHYGLRRAPLRQLTLALGVVRSAEGLLVLPTLGQTQKDPEFLETLHNAEVPFEVLDQPSVTRDTILAWGMSALRTDQRR